MSESCNIRREGDEMVCHTHARRWEVGTAPACPTSRVVFATGNPDALLATVEGRRYVAVFPGCHDGKTARAKAMKQIEEILRK